MNAQELLTAPSSTLTRKQRKERAALKRQMAEKLKIPRGYTLGRAVTSAQSGERFGVDLTPRSGVVLAVPEDWGGRITIPRSQGPVR